MFKVNGSFIENCSPVIHGIMYRNRNVSLAVFYEYCASLYKLCKFKTGGTFVPLLFCSVKKSFIQCEIGNKTLFFQLLQ